MAQPVAFWAAHISAGGSTVVEPPFLLTLSNASLGLTVAEGDARSALELGYGTGDHGEFPRSRIILAALLKDRCDSGRLKMDLKPGGRYLLTAMGPNDIDVIGYFSHAEVPATNGSKDLRGGGNIQGEEGNGDDGPDDRDAQENGTKAEPVNNPAPRKQAADGRKTKTPKVTTRSAANATMTPVASEAGSVVSTRRRGRPSNAEKAARQREAAAKVEEASNLARREEEEADRRAALRKPHHSNAMPQENIVFDGASLYQGAFLQGNSGGNQYGHFLQGNSQHHTFLEGSSKAKGKAPQGN